jgi:hypothetical protein
MKKDKVIRVRIDEEKLVEIGKQTSSTISGFIRSLIDAALKPASPVPS